MRHLIGYCVVGFLGLGIAHFAEAAKPPARPTHRLQPVRLEVLPTQPDGNPWDGGIGSYLRPDLQVTLMRHDVQAFEQAARLVAQVAERRMKEGGQPVPPELRDQVARSAVLQLRCGAAIEALADPELTQMRGQFAADTTVATDALALNPTNGGLNVKLGDKVAIFVHDIDVSVHDVMGTVEIEITKDLLAKGACELKFGSVELLRVKLAPIGK
jgi:hypothetical protein